MKLERYNVFKCFKNIHFYDYNYFFNSYDSRNKDDEVSLWKFGKRDIMMKSTDWNLQYPLDIFPGF